MWIETGFKQGRENRQVEATETKARKKWSNLYTDRKEPPAQEDVSISDGVKNNDTTEISRK